MEEHSNPHQYDAQNFAACNIYNGQESSPHYYDLDSSNELLKLLSSWGMPHLLNKFIERDVDIDSLKVLTESELIELFPISLGIRAKVRAKIIDWRLKNNLPDVTELNKTDGRVLDWLQHKCENSPSSTSTNLNNNNIFTLSDYLKNNTKFGAAYEKLNILPDFLREELIEGIVKNYIDLNIHMKHQNFIEIRDQVCETFENEPKDVYYNINTKTGRLFSVYKTKIAKLRKFGFPVPVKKRKLNLTINEGSQLAITDPSEDHKWLKNHVTPFATVEIKWTATAQVRAEQISRSDDKTITEIIGDWPPFKLPEGPRLIDIDFELQNPHKDLILLEKWPEFCKKIYPIVKSRIKDKYSIQQFKSLQFCAEGDQYNITLALLLHAILPPGGHAKEKDTKRTWKFSIADSQKAFILRLENSASYNEAIQKRKSTYAVHNMRMQPFIVIIGNDNYSIVSSIQVVYDNIIYSFDSFVKALSTTFKIHYVFNLSYQKECQAFWQFLQIYIFEILDDKTLTSVSQLLSLLKN